MNEPILSAAELEELRADETASMLDTCLVRRPTGRTVQNEDTGREENIYETVVSASPCSVRNPGASPTVRTVEIGGAVHPVIESGVKLPITDDPIRYGDEVVVTAPGPSSDPALADAVFRIVGFVAGSWTTARRLDVIRLS